MTSGINHDDVLGEEQLSQSSFGERNEPEDDEMPKKKKGSWIIFGAGGIAVLLFVGFFGWKILSPFFNRSGGVDAEMIVDAQPQANVPGATPAARTAQAQYSSGAPGSTPRPDASGQYQPVGAGQPGQGTTNPQIAAAPSGAAGVDANASAQNASAAPGTAQVPAQTQAPLPGPQVTLSEMEAVKARMDRMEQAIAALGTRLDKLPAQAQQNATPHSEPKKQTTAPAQPKPTPARQQNPPAKRASTDEPKSQNGRSDVQLKAVLDDRAWFQTKAGESITVGKGEEVKGLGVVDTIDAESGKVTFTNGNVAR